MGYVGMPQDLHNGRYGAAAEKFHGAFSIGASMLDPN
jgi:hypothetical protein